MTQSSQDQTLQNLTNQQTWIRLVYMLIYGVILHLCGILMWILCGVQFIFTLIFGQDNQNVRDMCTKVTQYIHEALAFVSYNSERKPFPFNNEGQKADNEDDVIDAEAEAATDDAKPVSASDGMPIEDADAAGKQPE
jgi:hypothetical protein